MGRVFSFSRWLSMAVASTLVLPAGAAAQSGPADVHAHELRPVTLEELLNLPTVTASGGEVENRATAAANVVFIERAEIIRNGWQSVAEALATVPGLYLIDSGTAPSLGVRGVTGGVRAGTRLVKVMIDGVAVNFRPDLQAFLGPEYLPMEAIERIEVAMGPLSSLYGANAFIATVNIITRSATYGTFVEAAGAAQYLDHGRPGWRTSGMATYGGSNVTLLLAAATANVDRSGRRVQHTFAAQDPNEGRFQPYFAEPSRNDVASPSSAFAQLKVLHSPLGELTLEGGLQRLDATGEFELNSTLTHESRETLTNTWLALKLDKKWSPRQTTTLALGVSGGSPNREEQFYLTGSRARSFKRNFDYRALDASLTWLLTLGPRLSLRFGVDGELDQETVLYYTAIFNQPEGTRKAGDHLDLIGDGQPRQQLLSDVGADLQMTLVPFEAMRLTASGRVDRVSYGGFGPPLQVSWRLAMTYKWSDRVFAKVIAGKAFQAPSGVLMFAEPGFGAANNIIGNLNATGVPGLHPQTIESGELVIYDLVSSRVALEASAFFQVLKDKIEFRSAGTDYVARNGGQTSYVGAEGAARFDFGRWKPFFTGAAVATMEGRTVQLAPPAAYPNLVGTAGIDVDLLGERLHFNGRLRWVGERGATPSNLLYNLDMSYSLPAFTTVDLTVSTARLFLLGETTETRIVLSAADLLNQTRSEPASGGYDLPVIGRRLLLEVRQSF